MKENLPVKAGCGFHEWPVGLDANEKKEKESIRTQPQADPSACSLQPGEDSEDIRNVNGFIRLTSIVPGCQKPAVLDPDDTMQDGAAGRGISEKNNVA